MSEFIKDCRVHQKIASNITAELKFYSSKEVPKIFSTSLYKKYKDPAHGFTLVEILIAIAILGILAGIAIPNYISYREKTKISEVLSEMKNLEAVIIEYFLDNDEFPDSLNDIGMDRITDPWGNPYRYLRIRGGTTPGLNGKRRRDKNANPVNSDFDLYSMGSDGKTAPQFTAKKARDDIVRANDGAYFGLAEKH